MNTFDLVVGFIAGVILSVWTMVAASWLTDIVAARRERRDRHQRADAVVRSRYASRH